MTEPQEARSRFPVGPVIAVALLGIALGAFVVQNTQDTTVEWLVWDGTLPLWLVLIVTSAAAIVLARLALALLRRRRRDPA